MISRSKICGRTVARHLSAHAAASNAKSVNLAEKKNPKSVLIELYSKGFILKPEYSFSSLMTDGKLLWSATCLATLNSPEKTKVVGENVTASSKSIAATSAAINLLESLKKNYGLDSKVALLRKGSTVTAAKSSPTTNEKQKSSASSSTAGSQEMSARQKLIQFFGQRGRLGELKNLTYEHLKKSKDLENQWRGSLVINWPMQLNLSVVGKSKQTVTNALFEQAMETLQHNGLFAKQPSEAAEILSGQTLLHISYENRSKITNLLDSFNQLETSLSSILSECIKIEETVDVAEVDKFEESVDEAVSDGTEELSGSSTVETTRGKSDDDNAELIDVITGRTLNACEFLDDNWKEFRNVGLFTKQRKYRTDQRPRVREIVKTRESLPMSSMKEEFLKVLETNRVVLLRGDTGCGKTTQVPQIIFDSHVEKMNGASCNIVVTQPRRISAISVSERIAYERNERIGDVAGYKVRLKERLPQGNGSIFFTTPGMLLRMRFRNPNFEGVSHVIVDEIHERDIWTDFLLISLKRAMKVNDKLKLILMSATFGVEKFQEYFDGAPVVEVHGRKFDVKEYFLEDVEKLLNKNQLISSNAALLVGGRLPVDVETVVNMLMHVHQTQEPGAILCFLPTTADIKAVQKRFNERNFNFSDFLLLPCHSRLPIHEQEKVFVRPHFGVRKIILATNIAETSITIDDVRYVVNTGMSKTHVFDEKSQSMRVVEAYACRDAQVQRKGRAGRVAEGICYHLFSKKQWEFLVPSFLPGLLQEQLSSVVLMAKIFSPHEDPSEFLSEAVDPPNDYQIENAVEELIGMKFLDEDRNLTHMGRRLAQFGCHPMLAKAILYGVVLKCLEPVLTVAAVYESRQNFFGEHFDLLEKWRKIEILNNFIKSSYSDFIFYANLFDAFRNRMSSEEFEESSKFDENLYYLKSFAVSEELRRLYADHVKAADICVNDDEASNVFKTDQNLIKSAISAGLHQNLLKLRRNDKSSKQSNRGAFYFSDNFGRRVQNLSKSIVDDFLDKKKPPPSVWFSCFDKVLDIEGRSFKVDSLSMISPMSVVLFSGFNLKRSNQNLKKFYLQPSVGFNFECENEKDVDSIFALRDVVDKLVEWHCLSVPRKILGQEQDTKFHEFHSNLLHLLSDLLKVDEVDVD